MKQQINIQRIVSTFSRWTRKSYAVFASVGKIVRISHLHFDLNQTIIKFLYSVDYNNEIADVHLLKFSNVDQNLNDNLLNRKDTDNNLNR